MKRTLLVAVAALLLGWWLRPVPSDREGELRVARQATARAEARAEQSRIARAQEEERTRRLSRDVHRSVVVAEKLRDSTTKLSAQIQMLSLNRVVVNRDTVVIPAAVMALLEQRRLTVDSQHVALVKYQGLEQQWTKERAAFQLELNSLRAAHDTATTQHKIEVIVAYERGLKRGRLEGAAVTALTLGGVVYLAVRIPF